MAPNHRQKKPSSHIPPPHDPARPQTSHNSLKISADEVNISTDQAPNISTEAPNIFSAEGLTICPPTCPPTCPRSPSLRCTCLTFLSITVIAGITSLVIGLITRPSSIEYTIEDANIHNFNISSNNTLKATFNLTFISHNKNRKVGIWYDSVNTTVWYDNQKVAASVESPSFFQPEKNDTTINVGAVAQATPLEPSVVVDNLKRNRTFGRINFEVKLHARIRFKIGPVKTKHYVMKVECSPLVYYPSHMPFNRTYCDVDI